MTKGIIGAIIIFFVIALAVAVISYALGTILSRQGIAKRGLFEASLISESDKVETYARSFLRATDLSTLQAIYDSGMEYILLPYDFDSSNFPRYSDNYKMAYWQIYNDENKRMPPPEIMLNRIRQEISWISSCYLYDYLKSYRDFAQASDFAITLPDPDLSPIITRVKYIDNQTITTEAEKIFFRRTTEVEDQIIDIIRGFNPYSTISTKFAKTIYKAWNITSNDVLGNCVRKISCSYTDKSGLQTELNRISNNFKESDINVIFHLKDYVTFGSNVKAVINVSIYHNSSNYTLYSFLNDRVRIGFLGVNFLVKVGDLVDNSDETTASSIYEFKNCDIASGYSGLGIISSKSNSDDICKFFKVKPKTCEDFGNNFYIKETCEDFTGSYEDTCFGSTLYQYQCHPYNICYHEKRDCLIGCLNGACICGPDSCETLLYLIMKKFGSSCDNPEGSNPLDPSDDYDRVADINKDTKIDISDAVFVSLNCGNGNWCQARLEDPINPCAP